MKLSTIVKQIQYELNRKGERLAVDGDFGPKTEAALEKYDLKISLTSFQVEKIEHTERQSPPWYLFALKFKGRKETDPEFNREMSKKWSLFGMNLGTIAENWAAWCGLAMAVALSGVGLDYARNGSLAKNWQTYGIEIDWKKEGIPQGAIVQINHGMNCKSESGNHVAQANGDCSPEDLARPKASIDLYGGNQGNTWKVSTYPVEQICAVRWPKDPQNPPPGMILQSRNCSDSPSSDDSTR